MTFLELGTAAATGDQGVPPLNGFEPYDAAPIYAVSSPDLPDLGCTVAVKHPAGPVAGTVVIFSGADGNEWWTVDQYPAERWIDRDLVAAGWRVVCAVGAHQGPSAASPPACPPAGWPG